MGSEARIPGTLLAPPFPVEPSTAGSDGAPRGAIDGAPSRPTMQGTNCMVLSHREGTSRRDVPRETQYRRLGKDRLELRHQGFNVPSPILRFAPRPVGPRLPAAWPLERSAPRHDRRQCVVPRETRKTPSAQLPPANAAWICAATHVSRHRSEKQVSRGTPPYERARRSQGPCGVAITQMGSARGAIRSPHVHHPAWRWAA